MKKSFVASIMLAITVTFAAAQQQQRQRQTPEERAKSQTERLDKLVKLTADQKKKIETINLDLSKQMDAKMQSNQGNQGNREAMRTAMQEVDKTRDEKYKAVLTDAQFKKYAEDKAQRQKEMAERRGQRNNNNN
jgi:hypothetical protein